MKNKTVSIIVAIIILLALLPEQSEARNGSLAVATCCIGTISFGLIPFSTASAAYYANRGEVEFDNYYWWTLLGAEVGSIVGFGTMLFLIDVFEKPGETFECEPYIGYGSILLASLAGAFAAYYVKDRYEQDHNGDSRAVNKLFTFGLKTQF